MNIQEAAKLAAANYGGSNALTDPTAIITFFDAILAFLERIRAKNQSEAESIAEIRRPTFFQAIQGRRMIRDMYVLSHGEALRMWRAIQDTGDAISNEDASELLHATDTLEV